MAVRKSQEEKPRIVDENIAYHEKHIIRLKKERAQLPNPPTRRMRVRKPSMKTAIDALKEAGLSPEEILALAAKARAKANKS